MTKLKIVIVLMILPVLAIADDNAPKTPAVRGALVKLEQAKADAKAFYVRAVARAVEDATRELDKLKIDVMKRGDLDEANRIAKTIEGVGKGEGESVNTEDLVGTWKVSYTNNNHRVYTFSSDGTLVVGEKKGTWVLRDGLFFLNEGGPPKRVTVKDNRLFIETLTDNQLVAVGVGIRSVTGGR